MSSLKLINTTTVSSAANKITVSDVFSADYNIYCIQVVGTTCASQRENNSMDMRFIGTSSGEITSNDYAREYTFMRGFSDAFFDSGSVTRDEFNIIYHDTAAQNGVGNSTVWVFNPYSNSTYTMGYLVNSGRMSYPGTTQRPYFSQGVGALKTTESITGFTFTNRDNYNIATGTFRTYGLLRT
tara:strand:- start:191 stop:739 length:549 start_codon:yes stop_codon:yes gene_type:complete